MVNNNLVGGWPTPLKNMKVSWEYDSQYMGNKMFQTTNQMIYSRPWILGMKYDYIWEIVCMKFSMIRYWDVDTFIILHLYRDCIGTWDDHGDQKSAQPMGFYLGKTKCVSGSNHWIPMIWWDHNGNTWWAMKLVGCCESEVGRSRWIYIIYLYSSVLSGDTNQVLQLIPRLIYLAVISKGLSLLTWSKIHSNTYRHFKEHLKWKSQQ